MTVEALAIANEFIDLAAEREEQLTPMKLQKLVYYAHGWWLGLTSQPLAWRGNPGLELRPRRSLCLQRLSRLRGGSHHRKGRGVGSQARRKPLAILRYDSFLGVATA